MLIKMIIIIMIFRKCLMSNILIHIYIDLIEIYFTEILYEIINIPLWCRETVHAVDQSFVCFFQQLFVPVLWHQVSKHLIPRK